MYILMFSDVLKTNYIINIKNGCQQAAPIPMLWLLIMSNRRESVSILTLTTFIYLQLYYRDVCIYVSTFL